MSREKWKNLFRAGIGSVGWFYAAMLTWKEATDSWQAVPWYELLLVSVVGFGILVPGIIGLWANYVSTNDREDAT